MCILSVFTSVCFRFVYFYIILSFFHYPLPSVNNFAQSSSICKQFRIIVISVKYSKSRRASLLSRRPTPSCVIALSLSQLSLHSCYCLHCSDSHKIAAKFALLTLLRFAAKFALLLLFALLRFAQKSWSKNVISSAVVFFSVLQFNPNQIPTSCCC